MTPEAVAALEADAGTLSHIPDAERATLLAGLAEDEARALLAE